MAPNRAIFKHKINYKLNHRFNMWFTLTHSVFLYMVLFIGIFCLIAAIVGDKTPDQRSQIISSSVIAAIGILYPFIFLPLNAHFATRRLQKSIDNGTEIFEISKDKIVKYDDKTPKKYILNWVTILKVKETDKAFYFYTTNEASFVIDKEGAEGDSCIILRKLILENLVKKSSGRVPYKITEKKYVEEKKREKINKRNEKKANAK